MKCATWVIASVSAVLGFGLFLASTGGGLGLAWIASASAEEAKRLPSLKIDRSAPLLLDALPEMSTKTEEGADNESCYCCHRNYETESLVSIHAKEQIGCIKCHGESFDHRNDEDHRTPPDIMYPLAKIEAACVQCHETHDAPAKKVVALWQKRCPSKTNPTELVCTDCHGEHRLSSRVARWDKQTGKFLGGDKAKPAAKDPPSEEMK